MSFPWQVIYKTAL